MRPLIVIGNWKMNGSLASNADWVKTVCRGMEQGMPSGRQYAFCAPFPYLSQCGQLIRDCSLAFLTLGAQDVSAHTTGAYTGEVAASMLKEMACKFVIVGHSERRQLHQETDELVAEKALQALDCGMTPVICVGESADERNSGREVEVVRGQIAKQVAVLQDRLADCLIAYEPIWAIGTGLSATPEQAQSMHEFIRGRIAGYDEKAANTLRILYGGSVNPINASQLLVMQDIDGGLIGRCSLDANDFEKICLAAASVFTTSTH